MAIIGKLSTTGSVNGSVTGAGTTTGKIILPTVISPETYTGAYEVTPGDEAVTLSTAGLNMSADVVVNPIPSNYGKISWNGSTLTVS